MSIIIARSNPSCSSSGGSVPTTTMCLPVVNVQKFVDTNTTVILDTFPSSRALAMKWYVVLSTISGSKDRAFEVVATEQNGSITFCTYAILGDKMDCDVEVIYNLGSYELLCTSIEAEGVVAYIVRTFVPPSAVSTSISNNVNVEHISTIANVSATTVIDIIRKERYQAVKWLITITDGNGDEHTSQVFSLPATGTGTNYGLIGKTHKLVKLNVIDDTQNVNLVVTNTSPTDIRVVATRIPIAPQLPDECNTPSDVSIWIPSQVVVNNGDTRAVDDQIPIPGHAAVRWLVAVTQDTAKMVFEVVANRNKLNEASFVQYGMIGDRIPIAANVTLVGMTFVLSITNGSAFPATINIIRVPTAV